MFTRFLLSQLLLLAVNKVITWDVLDEIIRSNITDVLEVLENNVLDACN